MPQLYDIDILLDACVNVCPEQSLKERPVLRQTADTRELVLEVAPDVVGFEAVLLFTSQQYLTPENLIVFFWVGVKRAHLLALNKTILHVLPVLKDLEQAFALIVVRDRVVSELNEDVYMGCCGRMHVMKCAFRHLA